MKMEGFNQTLSFALPAGTILKGKYLTGDMLGFGGFGITYLGVDLKKERKVALKEFMPSGIAVRTPGTLRVSAVQDERGFSYGKERFGDEARTLYRLNSHPNIVHVFDYFEENNTAYYVMEYLDGMDLRRYLKQKGGRLSYEEMLSLLLPVIDALEYVHEKNLLHRDISPDNIFIRRDKIVKLIDFGAARQALADESRSFSVILKKGFAPLEQYRRRGNQGPWTDIYALAATIYQILTGQRVPEAPERMMQDSLKPPEVYNPGIPKGGSDAIVKALSILPEDRQQTVRQFRQQLTGMSQGIRLHCVGGCYKGADVTVEDIAILGRNARVCQLVFPPGTKGVSGAHCQVICDQKQNAMILKDLNSTYGTWINGRPLPRGGECRLKNGDRISLGKEEVFEVEL